MLAPNYRFRTNTFLFSSCQTRCWNLHFWNSFRDLLFIYLFIYLPVSRVSCTCSCTYIKQQSQGGSVLQLSHNINGLLFLTWSMPSLLFLWCWLISPRLVLNPTPKTPNSCKDHFPFRPSCWEKQWAALFSCRIKRHECIVEIKNNKYYKSNMSRCLFSVNGLGRNSSLPHSPSLTVTLSARGTSLLFIRVTDEQCFRRCHFN